MTHHLITLALKHRYLVLFITLFLMIVGIVSFKNLPIEAYPDIADTWVQVISQWDGHAAEEIEKQITIPLEIALNSVAHHTSLRSVSLFGLSVVTQIFDEQTQPFTARQYVLEKLNGLALPSGVQPTLAPMSSPVGQIYFYFLDSTSRSPMELKGIEDWELEKRFKQVPGVADVSSFGGQNKEFQILINPVSLASYDIGISAVVQALTSNNQNSGGGLINSGGQAYNIRGVGLANSTRDLETIIVTQKGGTPIQIGNLAHVVIGAQPRLGNISLSEHRPDGTVDHREDVIEGIVVSRVGENDQEVLNGIHKKVKEINRILPSDVKVRPFLDRSDLINLTTRTVEENLATGMILVLLILLFFLGNLRSALIVASTIPVSLLFACILLDFKKIPANLLSLGALDFGMIVDGAVVMVENIFRHQQNESKEVTKKGITTIIIEAAKEVERPIVYAVAIIIFTYLPIFTLQRIEGRLFTPMAWTIAFALLGSLVIVLTVVPVLCSLFLKSEIKEWHNPVILYIESKYRLALQWALARRNLILGISLGSFILALILAFGGIVGSEFLPHLDEGAIWVRGTLPPSTSYDLAKSTVTKARKIFMEYPEVPITVCQLGRPDDGTDATGFFNIECFVDLKPRGEWRGPYKTKELLISALNQDLSQIPGVIWNFSQPISDNVEEMMSGVKGELVVKIYGEDLKTLSSKAAEVKKTLGEVKGIEDLGVFDELGQPNINLSINRDLISRYGLNVSDVQDVIETAVGGKAASQVIDGERRYNATVRYQPQYRSTAQQIGRILVSTPDGFRIPLEELAEIKLQEGASMIYRESNSRYIAIKFSVRGRDLGGTIEEAQKRIKSQVLFPPGYTTEWSGEFESQKRAEARLAIVVPLTIIAILFILYVMFDSIKWALIIITNVVLARIGGVLALFLTGTHFSVSSGIGFLAVFGVSIQTGVLLISYINQMRSRGASIREAVIEGSCLRLRPIMMTALVATFGLLPAAFSHAIGSDSQRPMAIVIVGGLITDLIMAFFLLPTLYLWFARDNDRLL